MICLMLNLLKKQKSCLRGTTKEMKTSLSKKLAKVVSFSDFSIFTAKIWCTLKKGLHLNLSLICCISDLQRGVRVCTIPPLNTLLVA